MASVVINGDTSGSVSVTVPATAGSNTITLPAVTGTAVIGSSAVSAAGQIPFSTDGSTYTPTAKIVSGTAVNLATGSPTSVDFSSIPSWVKRITIMLGGASTNGTSLPQVQLGDSGGIETTGYLSTAQNASASANSSTGYLLTQANASSSSLTGNAFLCKLDGNTWIISGDVAQAPTVAASVSSLGGSKTLSDTLTTVRLTTVNGTDTFDAGTINILYE
jgi:hypothetical protein